MVLPPSSTDPQAGTDHWLSRIGRVLHLAREQGLVVLVTDAVPTQLRALMVALGDIARDTGAPLRACVHAQQVLSAPVGSIVVLEVHPRESAWLNENRPLFSERCLRVVLWADSDAVGMLKRDAPDFFDWISHAIPCPERDVPAFAVAGARCATRYPGIVWRGEALAQTLACAYPDASLQQVAMPSFLRPGGYARLLKVMGETPGWLAIERVGASLAVARIRWAMAESGRTGNVVLVDPDCDAPGWWSVSDELMTWRAASYRLEQLDSSAVVAALLDLEPSAVDLAAELAVHGRWSDELAKRLARADDPGAALARWADERGWLEREPVARGLASACISRGLFYTEGVAAERQALCTQVQGALTAFHAGATEMAEILSEPAAVATWAGFRPALSSSWRWPPMYHNVYAIEAALAQMADAERDAPVKAIGAVIGHMVKDMGQEDIVEHWVATRSLKPLAKDERPLMYPAQLARIQTLWADRRGETKNALQVLLADLDAHSAGTGPDDAIARVTRGEMLYFKASLAHERDAESARDTESLYREALSLLQPEYGEEHPVCLGIQLGIGFSLLAQDKLPEAEFRFRRSLGSLTRGYVERFPLTTLGRLGLASTLRRRGDDREAANLAFGLDVSSMDRRLSYREGMLLRGLDTSLTAPESVWQKTSDQELLHAWRGGDEPAGQQLSSYLFSAARRVLWRHRRLRHNSQLAKSMSLPAGDFGPDVRREVVRREESALLMHALQTLPVQSQLVLALYGQHLKTGEIAEALGVSASTARARLRRARKQLERALEQLSLGPRIPDIELQSLEHWAEAILSNHLPEDDEHQLILLLDLARDNPVSMATVQQLIPPSDRRDIFRLRDYLDEAPDHTNEEKQLQRTAAAIDRMLEHARSRLPTELAGIHVYVAGRVPLPIWAYLGMQLSRSASPVTCLYRLENGSWGSWPRYPMDGASAEGPYFNDVRGLEGPAKMARGKVGVFLSRHFAAPDAIHAFMQADGSEPAGLVSIVSRTESSWLGDDRAQFAHNELVKLLSDVARMFPNHEGLVLFVAGPSPLALVAGLAVDTRIFSPVWVPIYRESTYRPGIVLPRAR